MLEEDSEIVGIAGFQRQSGRSIGGIFVAQNKQSSGIGPKLKDKKQQTREENLEEMEALASLEAVKLYKKRNTK